MDPLSASLVLATIVQLLAIYKQEGKDRNDLDHRKFVDWLQEHHFSELKSLVINNTLLQSEMDRVLREDHARMMTKLDAINGSLATLLSRVDLFAGLVSAVMPSARLSPQAVSVLKQFAESGSSYFNQTRNFRTGTSLHLERGGYITFNESRLLDDDLDGLVSAGLLRRDESKREPLFRITRAGINFVQNLA